MGKSFKNKGGFGSGMYQSDQADTKKQKPSKKGFIRHTFMVKPDHLAQLREVSELAEADIQDILAAALTRYFNDVWPDKRLNRLRNKRKKQKEEKEDLLGL